MEATPCSPASEPPREKWDRQTRMHTSHTLMLTEDSTCLCKSPNWLCIILVCVDFHFIAAESCKIWRLAQLKLRGLYSLNINTNFLPLWLKAVQSLHTLLPSNVYLLPHKLWLQVVLRNITEK